MKIQYIAIIFVMIFLPIVLVTTFYIQQQTSTIEKQLRYDANILDATHDAMTAFEINTANEDLSTVSDSLRSIIDASNNILLNTLAINFGISNASKSYVQPYIPAVLYSLYDGYYIYSPTRTPIVCTDQFGQTINTDSFGVSFIREDSGRGIYEFNNGSIGYGADGITPISGDTVDYNVLPNDLKEEYGQILYKNKDGTYSTVIKSGTASSSTEYKISYILKSYVPYAVSYTNSTYDITINYTLDNFITVMGTINNIYYTKSGYVIKNDLVNSVKVNGTTISWNTYSDEELEYFSKNPDLYNVEIELNVSGNIITLNNRENIQLGEYWDDAKNSVAYYARAWAFSSWVYDTLEMVTEYDVVKGIYDDVNKKIGVAYVNEENVNENLLYDFNESLLAKNSAGVKCIFNDEMDPEDVESNFEQHRRHAIRNSITYNLAVAMTAYNEKYAGSNSFSMPILSDSEWDKILTKVSILTFMQGLNCGMKLYNNYALVCSTNNEISVLTDEIYYTEYTSSLTDTDVIETAHRLNCLKLNNTTTNDYYTSFKSKDIKYDKLYNSITGNYDYDHMIYTCYTCLVNPNYNYFNGSGTESVKKNGDKKIIDTLLEMLPKDGNYISRIKAYYIAVGKEREKLYKPTEVSENTGIIYLYSNVASQISNGSSIDISSSFDLPVPSKKPNIDIANISKIEVVISDTQMAAGTVNLFSTTVNISANGYNFNQNRITTTTKTYRTLEFIPEFITTSAGNLNSIQFLIGNANVTFKVHSLKIYYK